MRSLKLILFSIILFLFCSNTFAANAVLEKGINALGPNVQTRQYHKMLDSVTITADYTTNSIRVNNITGIMLNVVADSSSGTPDYTISVQTSPDNDESTYYDVDAIVSPEFSNITDENMHGYLINAANLSTYVRFIIDLGDSDGGDDIFNVYINFQYGSITGISTISNSDLVDLGDTVGTQDSAVGSKGIQVVADARSSQATAVDNGDAIRFVTNLFGEIVVSGYNWLGDYINVAEVDPLSSQHVETTLADVTNGTDGTYYYYVDMDGYRYLTEQIELDGGSGTVTITMEITNQDDGTAQASCTYRDVTQHGFTNNYSGTSAASYTSSTILSINESIKTKYVRVKVVASTGGANDADWTIYSKKAY